MKVANMQDEIKKLIELQGLDTEMFETKRVLDGIPEKIKEFDELMESKKSSLKVLEDELKKAQVERKGKEIELETKEQTIKKHKAQLFQIKTNKEYTALEKEIASAKADNSLIEEEIIKVLDQIDEIQKRIVQEKELLRVEELKIAEEKKNIDADKKIKEANYAEIDIRRKAFAESINKSILARYDRILHNKDGLAMVPVISDACGGCNMNLPPQVVNEAKLMQDLTFCGNCARILYSIE